ncbi:hypothetical protein [Legionella drancourtii]
MVLGAVVFAHAKPLPSNIDIAISDCFCMIYYP